MIDLASIWGLLPPVKTPIVKVPRVLALIPDGNRRWAKLLGKLGSYGHTKGAERFLEVQEEAFGCGVQHIVFWAASFSNLVDRSPDEISHLVDLLKRELRRRIADPDRHRTRLRLIGHWRETVWADEELIDLVDRAEALTDKWTERQLTLLFGYDFRMDMEDTISALLSTCPNFGLLSRAEQKDTISKRLSTGFLGDVDFIIRTGTGNDPHWSASFLGWNVANAQLTFLKTPWPVFGVRELRKTLDDYGSRERRGGA